MELFYEFELEYDEESPFGKDYETDLKFLISEIEKKDDIEHIDLDVIEKSFRYAYEKHISVKRKSGIPYYTHPLSVTLILLNELNIYDTASLAACMLHDTIEDVESVGKEQITEEFDEEIAEIVDGVTKITTESLNYNDDIQKQKLKTHTYRKLFLALVKDVRVILIKLADRLHNIRTLHYLKSQKQNDIAQETLNFYVPLAHRLGLTKVKAELENRSFYYSDRETYEAIRTALTNKRRDFIDYIRVFSDHIQESLKKHDIEHILSIVHKHEYEIYQMIQDGKSISDIDNFYSMVLILESNDIGECYRAHGVLANVFNTVSFVDYIANSKLDWYKSLNTTLYGPDGKRVDILIRTQEMEKIAEEGFAAEFSLKDGRIRALEFTDKEIEEWGEWMKDIIETMGDSASQIIWDSIKVNLFDSELTIYSKDGKPYLLPEGATILDFAFALSNKTGLQCVTGKVNGVLHDIGYTLKSGDQVEIISSPNVTPKESWIRDVISHRAVVKLHNFFKDNKPETIQEKDESPKNIRLLIKGEDRANMLVDITEAIGKSYIRRINLDTTGHLFEGAVTVRVSGKTELNYVFSKLLSINGVKGVTKMEEEE